MKPEDDERKQEAKWLSDKTTLETGKNFVFVRDSEDKDMACKILRIDYSNYQKFRDEFYPVTLPIQEQELTPEDIDLMRIELGEAYEDIIESLKYYLDLREDYYNIIALWIIGTYLHKHFNSYPYLFINAMRGSGKTRLLQLIAKLSNMGELVASLTEAVLFRSNNNSTMCIDEFESLGSKERSALRELLNAGYKRGTKVKRMKKKKVLGQEEQVVEEFEIYKPMAMANIWGMEEVLGDRCISLLLEKSCDLSKTLLIENFETSQLLLDAQKSLKRCNYVVLCSLVQLGGSIYNRWNDYISNLFPTTNYITTYTPLTTQDYTKLHNNNNIINIKEDKRLDIITIIKEDKIFNMIREAGISGRNLELFFPLFEVAHMLNEDVFKKTLLFAQQYCIDKSEDEVIESRDVSLFEFVSNFLEKSFISVTELTKLFKTFIQGDILYKDYDDEQVNVKWMGKALKRLNLISKKRRLSVGIEVILNIDKAKSKMHMFKSIAREGTKE